MIEIDVLNRALAEQDDLLTAKIECSDEPLVVIFSLPRSASTLFQQLMISSIDIGYISNLVARFWRAPYLATQLDVDVRDPEYVSNFKSIYGNVVGAQEPHEWGWFWRYWLGLDENETYCSDLSRINAKGLAEKLGAIQSIWGAPLLIDSIFAIANFKILAELKPQILAVHLSRDCYYVCNSHINARLLRHGDIHKFYGLRPKNIDEIMAIEDPVEQIVAQVFALEQEINETLGEVALKNLFKVDYGELVSQPYAVVKRFAAFLESNQVRNFNLKPLPDLDLKFRDSEKYVNNEYKEKLDHYYELYFPD